MRFPEGAKVKAIRNGTYFNGVQNRTSNPIRNWDYQVGDIGVIIKNRGMDFNLRFPWGDRVGCTWANFVLYQEITNWFREES